MSKVIIYHGSEKIIQKPNIKAGKKHNDYGQGFYCTEEIELAKEWACKNDNDGFANIYELDLTNLKVLKLNSKGYTILNWIAILLKNRVFSLDTPVAARARSYIIEHFGIDTEAYDVIVGYRADDSYFSFARDFLRNTITVAQLSHAVELGKLGIQIVIHSQKAFSQLRYIESTIADNETYYTKRCARDLIAREEYRETTRLSSVTKNDLFIMDIIRQEVKNDDPRIQRNISR